MIQISYGLILIDLDLKPSIYDYTIKIIGSNSVIEGKLTVL